MESLRSIDNFSLQDPAKHGSRWPCVDHSSWMILVLTNNGQLLAVFDLVRFLKPQLGVLF
jgi:hypothetical protein